MIGMYERSAGEQRRALQSLRHGRYFRRFRKGLSFLLCICAGLLLLPAFGNILADASEPCNFARISYLILLFGGMRCMCVGKVAAKDKGSLATITYFLVAVAVPVQIWCKRNVDVLTTKALIQLFVGRLICGLGVPNVSMSVGITVGQTLVILLQILWFAASPEPFLKHTVPKLLGSTLVVTFVLYVLDCDSSEVNDLNRYLAEGREAAERLLKSWCDATVCLEMPHSGGAYVVESSPELDILFGTPMLGVNILDFTTCGKDRILQVLRDARDYNPKSQAQLGKQPLKEGLMTLRAFVTFEGIQDEFGCELRTVTSFDQPKGTSHRVVCSLHRFGEARRAATSSARLPRQRQVAEEADFGSAPTSTPLMGSTPSSSLENYIQETRCAYRLDKLAARLANTLQSLKSFVCRAPSSALFHGVRSLPGILLDDICNKLFNACGFACVSCQFPDLTITSACAQASAMFGSTALLDIPMAMLVKSPETYSALIRMATELKKQGFAVNRMPAVWFRTFNDTSICCDVVMTHVPAKQDTIVLGFLERSMPEEDSRDRADTSPTAKSHCSEVVPDDSVSRAGPTHVGSGGRRHSL